MQKRYSLISLVFTLIYEAKDNNIESYEGPTYCGNRGGHADNNI